MIRKKHKKKLLQQNKKHAKNTFLAQMALFRSWKTTKNQNKII